MLQAGFLQRDARCGGCGVNAVCLGGCPVWDLVGYRHTESSPLTGMALRKHPAA
jgi:radical SAM protein with 4Fe4S-binding SPASM domain